MTISREGAPSSIHRWQASYWYESNSSTADFLVTKIAPATGYRNVITNLEGYVEGTCVLKILEGNSTGATVLLKKIYPTGATNDISIRFPDFMPLYATLNASVHASVDLTPGKTADLVMYGYEELK